MATADAIYSDGLKYRPALDACESLGSDLNKIKTVLILGAGLGSMARILASKGLAPQCTLVDVDKLVLQWAMEFAEESGANMIPVCEDALSFVRRVADSYDLIFVDVFIGRQVPDFITSVDFLSKCRSLMAGNGRLALNYIVNDEAAWVEVQRHCAEVFPMHKIRARGVNRLIIV